MLHRSDHQGWVSSLFLPPRGQPRHRKQMRGERTDTRRRFGRSRFARRGKCRNNRESSCGRFSPLDNGQAGRGCWAIVDYSESREQNLPNIVEPWFSNSLCDSVFSNVPTFAVRNSTQAFWDPRRVAQEDIPPFFPCRRLFFSTNLPDGTFPDVGTFPVVVDTYCRGKQPHCCAKVPSLTILGGNVKTWKQGGSDSR